MNVSEFIGDISIVSVLVPIGFAVIQWRKLPKELSPLRWILIASLVCDILIHFASIKYRNSYPVVNSYILIQFSILLYIFSIPKQDKKPFIVTYLLFIVFYVIDITLFENFFRLAANAGTLSSLILIFIVFKYLYKLLSELPTIHIQRLPMLWVAFAVLLYYACTLFVFLTNNFLLQNLISSQGEVWVVHNFFNITKNMLFAIALWRNYQLTKSSI